jgi:hypothetical protein
MPQILRIVNTFFLDFLVFEIFYSPVDSRLCQTTDNMHLSWSELLCPDILACSDLLSNIEIWTN